MTNLPVEFDERVRSFRAAARDVMQSPAKERRCALRDTATSLFAGIADPPGVSLDIQADNDEAWRRVAADCLALTTELRSGLWELHETAIPLPDLSDSTVDRQLLHDTGEWEYAEQTLRPCALTAGDSASFLTQLMLLVLGDTPLPATGKFIDVAAQLLRQRRTARLEHLIQNITRGSLTVPTRHNPLTQRPAAGHRSRRVQRNVAAGQKGQAVPEVQQDAVPTTDTKSVVADAGAKPRPRRPQVRDL